MTEEQSTPARERVLQAAEKLFSERGYDSVTLRDIANALGIKQASLYNHAPGGKEELYVAVMERGLRRHQENLHRVIQEAEPHLRAQLRAAARWLLSQPPLDLTRMSRSDLRAIDAEKAAYLRTLGGNALFQPIMDAVIQAYRRSEIRMTSPGLVAAAFLTLIDAAHEAHQYNDAPNEVTADDLIDMMLDGIVRR